jgi:preprotein translocase subunit Sec63
MKFINYILLALLIHQVILISPFQMLGISRKSTPSTINQALRKMLVLYKNDSKILSLLKEAYG